MCEYRVFSGLYFHVFFRNISPNDTYEVKIFFCLLVYAIDSHNFLCGSENVIVTKTFMENT